MGGTQGGSVRQGTLLPGEGEDARAVGDGAALQDVNMMATLCCAGADVVARNTRLRWLANLKIELKTVVF